MLVIAATNDALLGGLFVVLLLGMVGYALITGEAPLRRSIFGEVDRANRPGAYWGFLALLIGLAGIVAFASFFPR